jgi:dinuclear metal center YbgI/SA1388 family protein
MTTDSLPTIARIASCLEHWAPPGSAQSYDNVGLQVGDPSGIVRRAILALDCTHEVVDEAIESKADLIISHHPLIFRPLKSVTPRTQAGAIALRLASAGVALYSSHTNLDAATGGVSFALAARIGLEEVRLLLPHASSLYKLITFVPREHFDGVREALARAGAGRIGNYEACAFTMEGTGYFRPGEDADPFIGKAGGALESVQEIRLEVEVDRWQLKAALTALKAAHPYEEVAYDVVPLEQPSTRIGLGAWGELPVPVPFETFLQNVASALGSRSLHYSGRPPGEVRRVAVCGGAGSELVGEAARLRADAFVTADVTYHRFFEALDAGGRPRLALIDAGHYETEAVTEELLASRLGRVFPDVDWRKTSVRTSPVRTFVAG